MNMFPTDSNLIPITINKEFLEKSFQYKNNAVSFYTDGSKLDKNCLGWEFSSRFKLMYFSQAPR